MDGERFSVSLREGPLAVAEELARFVPGDGQVGGLGVFLGLVRGEAQGKTLTALHLEHYPEMTERAIAALLEEARRRWPLLGARIVHRVGHLLPGEPIVLVLTAAAHRTEALAATQFLIDWLKTKAPFWKKELYADGSAAWVEARAEDEAMAARWQDRNGQN
jgi:molybdopterin synthase catalytic subunit